MKGKQKKFWQFRNQADDPEHAELLLYGDISERTWYGDETTPRQFADDLAALGPVGSILVRINSGGGDVFAAQAIGNQLEQHSAKVTARIDGICASAATIVACHCDSVEAPEDSTYMVHLPTVGVMDYLDELAISRLAGALATVKDNIITLYARKTGMSKEDAAALIEAETWMTGPQAHDRGFVDILLEGKDAAVVENRSGMLFVNSIGMGLEFDKAPEFVRNRLASSGFGNTPPADTPDNDSHEEGNDMELNTTDDLRRECPELVNQIEQAAQENALHTERQRLREIDEVAGLFSARLVDEAKYGEKSCTAQELAYRAAVAAKKQGSAFFAALEKDAKDSGAGDVPPAPPADGKDDSPAAIRAAAKADAAAYNKMKEGK